MSSPGQYTHDEHSYAKLLPIINALPAQKSPLLALNENVKAFFKCGPDAAFSAFQHLQEGITKSTYKREGSRIDIAITPDLGLLSKVFSSSPNLNSSTFWKACTAATILVLLFACPNDAETMYASLKDQGRTFGGLPSYESVQNIPSTSFPLAFQRAKSRALNSGQTTVMVVSLHDVHYLHLAERGEEGEYFTFSHVFTVGIGPEGMVIWQAWGHNGYGLDEYIRDGHASLRTWDEAEQFVGDFDKLAHEEGTWAAHVNELYRKLFLVDINQVCGSNGPEPPVTPKFKAWVRIRILDNVTYEDVTKFRWVKG